MPDPAPWLRPGELLARVDERARHALACGAMQPIDTVRHAVTDAGVRFVVRQVSSLARKELERGAREGCAAPAPANPFLPPEPDLLVAQVTASHVAVLNKFNVMERHLLLVTRRFVHQEAWLAREDFEALAVCMAEFDSLGFYNGGAVAGASQPHRHLQLVPLPFDAAGPPVPVEALVADAADGRVPGLPFRNAYARLDPASFDRPDAAAGMLAAAFEALAGAVGLEPHWVNGELRQSMPYNLLATRRWMLLVPRSAEHAHGISLNALGFAGSLFVRDAAQLETVRWIGPMALLRAVAVP
jgi:ATP adenylyltransferase